MFTKERPIVTAITVVTMYIPSVLNPSLPSLEMSASSDTPLINENKTIGTAIIFNNLMKIFPNGSIQFSVNLLQPR